MPRRSARYWTPEGERQPPHEPIWPAFVDAYLRTALWASVGEDDEPLDAKFETTDFDEPTVQKAIRESNQFIKENREDLEEHGEPSQHGHDFWLTRNRHGAGFWDRDYPRLVGERLTEAAQKFGEAYVFEDPAGSVYIESGF